LRRKRPGDYVPFDGYFAAGLDEAVPWEDRYPQMIEALAAELDNLDTKEFHTTLMLAGNVPVALLRPEILEHARELASQD
jgi:hypothetical protein